MKYLRICSAQSVVLQLKLIVYSYILNFNYIWKCQSYEDFRKSFSKAHKCDI